MRRSSASRVLLPTIYLSYSASSNPRPRGRQSTSWSGVVVMAAHDSAGTPVPHGLQRAEEAVAARPTVDRAMDALKLVGFCDTSRLYQQITLCASRCRFFFSRCNARACVLVAFLQTLIFNKARGYAKKKTTQHGEQQIFSIVLIIIYSKGSSPVFIDFIGHSCVYRSLHLWSYIYIHMTLIL